MHKSQYQILRYSVEAEIANFNSGNIDDSAFASSLMRLFLQASSAEQVRTQLVYCFRNNLPILRDVSY